MAKAKALTPAAQDLNNALAAAAKDNPSVAAKAQAVQALVAAQPGNQADPASQPDSQAAPRKNAHGIGKAWQGQTSVTRMALPEMLAYQAYLQGIAKPNARQQRHLQRVTAHIAKAQAAQAAQAATDA